MNAENKETEELQKCSRCGCKKLLKFFKVRENTGQYYKTCIKCCEKSLENIKKCVCGKSKPYFGFEGDKRPTCCNVCKKDRMIDIKNKKCLCSKRPYFGFEGDKNATCCTGCKQDGMVDIKNKKCVCGKNPAFGFEGDKTATCCYSCKQEGMINIKSKRCKTNYCDILANRRYRGYCSRCFFFTFPNEKLTRNYKTKENTIVNHVLEKFPQYDWTNDRKISDGCSLKRPDLYCDFGDHIIVIEVDENSHRGYNCEERRMFTIVQDFGMRPTIFLRINPDKYTDEKTGKVIKSPFVMKKETGKLEVDNKKELNRRLKHLCEKIEYYSDEKDYKIFNLDEIFF